METYTAKKLQDLGFIANEVLSKYNSDKTFAFYGKMGSGKTTFIKELCKQLGVKETITSPTFALINEYPGKNNIKIFHFDFYRIEKQEEVYDFGYEEYFFNDNYCLIEWPELIENLLPENFIKITISVDEKSNNRIFTAEKIKSL